DGGGGGEPRGGEVRRLEAAAPLAVLVAGGGERLAEGVHAEVGAEGGDDGPGGQRLPAGRGPLLAGVAHGRPSCRGPPLSAPGSPRPSCRPSPGSSPRTA